MISYFISYFKKFQRQPKIKPTTDHQANNYQPNNCSVLEGYLAHFSAQAPKTKKNPPRKKFLIFGKWNFLTRRLKIFLYFSKKPSALFSPSQKKKIHSEKKLPIFQEMELLSSNIKKI